MFIDFPDIIPPSISKGMSISDLVNALGQTSFEARNVYRGTQLYKRMIGDNDTIWLGLAGAGVAGGMGRMLSSLLEAGFVDVICSTGAQVYHDLHFAFDLPVKAISPFCNDDVLGVMVIPAYMMSASEKKKRFRLKMKSYAALSEIVFEIIYQKLLFPAGNLTLSLGIGY